MNNKEVVHVTTLLLEENTWIVKDIVVKKESKVMEMENVNVPKMKFMILPLENVHVKAVKNKMSLDFVVHVTPNFL